MEGSEQVDKKDNFMRHHEEEQLCGRWQGEGGDRTGEGLESLCTTQHKMHRDHSLQKRIMLRAIKENDAWATPGPSHGKKKIRLQKLL